MRATMKAARYALLGAYALLLLAPFVDSADRSEVFGDEIGFISSGHAAMTRLLHGDLFGPGWTANDWGDYGWNNPTLGKVILGAAIYASGHGGHEYGTWVNKLPGANREEVRAARWPGVFLGWGACLLLLAVGWRISAATGIVASLYAAFNNSFVWSCALAMLEAPLMFFMVLTLLLLLRLKDHLYGGGSLAVVVRGALGVGLAAACATSAKLNGGAVILFALVFLAALAASPLLRLASVPQPRLAAAAASTVLLIAPLGFYLLNPQFYRHPIDQLWLTRSYWRERYSPERLGDTAVSTLRQSFSITTRAMLSGIPTSKQLYRPVFEVWARRWPVAKEQFETGYVGRPGSIEALLMAVAVFSVALRRWRRGRRAPVSDEEVLLAFAVFIWAAMIAWLPLVQGRYFLFPFVTTPLLVALGACEVAAAVAAAVRRPWSSRPAT